jgi:hypothetical protein
MNIQQFASMCSCLSCSFVFTSVACAGLVVDLTTVGSEGSIGDGIYRQFDGGSTGTGVINSFAQIKPHGNDTMSSGYNTTVNDVLDNGHSDNFNRSIFLDTVPVVSIAGEPHREFLLDVNGADQGPVNGSVISLDEIQVFVGGTANSSVDTFTGGILDHDGTLIYQMDEVMDNWVAIDYDLNSGSGSGDIIFYLLDSLFTPFDGSEVVTLYSEFGQQGVDSPGVAAGDYGQNAGFEEWAVQEAGVVPVPEPSAGLLAAIGVMLCGCRSNLSGRRKRH